MVRLITVEREYGSGGAEFAHRLSEVLGWRVIDRCLVEEVAEKAQVSPGRAEECDERLDPWYHRFGKAFWQGAMENMPSTELRDNLFDSERMAVLSQERVLSAAAEGHCVIVGRGASSILHTYPGAFHVFVFAGRGRKREWFETHFPDRKANAEQEMMEADERRAAYVRRFFDREWDDRKLYHLMLDTCMGEEAMLGAVLAGAGLRHLVPSQAAV